MNSIQPGISFYQKHYGCVPVGDGLGDIASDDMVGEEFDECFDYGAINCTRCGNCLNCSDVICEVCYLDPFKLSHLNPVTIPEHMLNMHLNNIGIDNIQLNNRQIEPVSPDPELAKS